MSSRTLTAGRTTSAGTALAVPDLAVSDPAEVARRLPRRAASSSTDVARRLPRPQSLPVPPATSPGEQGVGHTDLGLISVDDSVVAKLASRAAVEVEDVGAAATRVLGKELSGGPLDKLGMKSSEIGALPSCSAQVDGQLAFVDLTISVRYPASVRQVAAAVREKVTSRVGQMTGLQIVEVDIKVPALVRELPRPARVH